MKSSFVTNVKVILLWPQNIKNSFILFHYTNLVSYELFVYIIHILTLTIRIIARFAAQFWFVPVIASSMQQNPGN